MLPETHRYPVMCITQDGLGLSHEEQVEQLCRAGAKWIQLRMKVATASVWLRTAQEVVSICRSHGAVCIVNDSVDVAIQSRADGVHLGSLDGDWRVARKKIGRLLLGGTVNNEADAARALECEGLDYVGVGPWRFTATKKNLSPVLGAAGVRRLVAMLDGIPSWVIGGVEPADAGEIRVLGAAGVAISSGLYRGGCVDTNLKAYAAAWAGEAV